MSEIRIQNIFSSLDTISILGMRTLKGKFIICLPVKNMSSLYKFQLICEKKVNAYPCKLILCQGSIARLDMVDKNLGLLQTPHLVRASEEDTVKIRVAVVFTLPWTCRFC